MSHFMYHTYLLVAVLCICIYVHICTYVQNHVFNWHEHDGVKVTFLNEPLRNHHVIMGIL